MHWWSSSRLPNILIKYLHGDKGTIDFTPLNMVTPSTEEEVEEERKMRLVSGETHG